MNSNVEINKPNVDRKEKGPEINTTPVITPGQLVMKRFLRNKLAIIGIVILAVMMLFSFIGPMFSSYSEYGIFFEKEGVELEAEDLDFSQGGIKILSRAQPSARHPLGTDKDGRDILIRLMYGGRISLSVGFIVMGLELLIGVTLGGIAGYNGKKIDNFIMRIVDVINCIPSMPILLILSSISLALRIDQKYKIFILMVALGLLGWPGVARIVRGQILSLREQEFMVAAEAVGLRPVQKIFKHLIPNVMPQLIVITTLGIGGVILTESALSFLGIGLAFPYASWGNMVNTVNDPVVLRQYLNMWVPPGVAIFVTVMGFNFVGDGLRDAFDPKMKR